VHTGSRKLWARSCTRCSEGSSRALRKLPRVRQRLRDTTPLYANSGYPDEGYIADESFVSADGRASIFQGILSCERLTPPVSAASMASERWPSCWFL
jgi:hypothetical protein